MRIISKDQDGPLAPCLASAGTWFGLAVVPVEGTLSGGVYLALAREGKVPTGTLGGCAGGGRCLSDSLDDSELRGALELRWCRGLPVARPGSVSCLSRLEVSLVLLARLMLIETPSNGLVFSPLLLWYGLLCRLS